MSDHRCGYCQQFFQPAPYHPQQTVCSGPTCQNPPAALRSFPPRLPAAPPGSGPRLPRHRRSPCSPRPPLALRCQSLLCSGALSGPAPDRQGRCLFGHALRSRRNRNRPLPALLAARPDLRRRALRKRASRPPPRRPVLSGSTDATGPNDGPRGSALSRLYPGTHRRTDAGIPRSCQRRGRRRC